MEMRGERRGEERAGEGMGDSCAQTVFACWHPDVLFSHCGWLVPDIAGNTMWLIISQIRCYDQTCLKERQHKACSRCIFL